MSDNHQAELLARWLSESGRGEPAPEGLDDDAVEAILALRPDLAPPARVDIDDILGAVEEGPFAASVEGEGAALADWLDGGALDADLDADIQEAVFALRPDLAPAPRVDMDDIFGAVTEGPFARAAAPAAAPEVAPVVSLAEVRQQRASRRRWWAPVGAIAAAAAALLMINPAVMNLPEPTMDLSLEQGDAPAASAPAAAPEAEPAVAEASPAPPTDSLSTAKAEERKDAISQDAQPSRGAEGPIGGEAAELSAVTGSAAPDPYTTAKEGSVDGNTGGLLDVPAKPRASSTRSAPAAQAPAPEETTEALEALGYVDGASGFGAGDLSDSTDMDGALADDDLDDFSGGAEYANSEPAEPAPEPEAAAARSEIVTEADESRESASRGRDRGGITMPRLGRNQAAEAAADAPAAVSMEEAEEERSLSESAVVDESVRFTDAAEDMPELGQAALLDRLRASAGSLRPVPDVGAKYPALAAAYAAADAEWNAGRMDVAIGLLAPFAVHPDPDVVLDVTYHHALMRYRTGEIPGALQVIAQGLRVSGGDGLLRSRLYVLQGQLLERRGQPEQAIQAYRQAVEVR